jgi:hypothetical protein
MPKIRDLGINTIPVTMRPPEIGGGGGPNQSACPGASCGPEVQSGCPGASCIEEQSGCPGASCNEEHSGCPGASCRPDDDENSHRPDHICPGASCLPDKPRSPNRPGKQAGAFTPQAVAQLRQQLETHISM